MPVYHRKRGSDMWHWCRNCDKDPQNDYDTEYTRPVSGELCNECKAKEKDGTCR